VPDSIVDAMSGGGAGRMTASDLRASFYFPDSYPPVNAVVAGADGTTWVARERRDGVASTWEVFDRGGQPLGRVEAPPGLTLHHADEDAIWGVVTDELDSPYVVRYSLARPAS
jgi:hypothetical protein